MALKTVGEDELLIQMTGAVTKAMKEYFSEEQRMDPAMCSSFAEAIMEKYPHEALGDIPVFIKYAGWARYGTTKEKRHDDGRIEKWVVDYGKTYGRLTLTTLMDWWGQFLGEKAEELEKVRVKELKAMNKEKSYDGEAEKEPLPILHDSVVAIMKKAHAETPRDDKDTGRRVNLLMRTVPHMGEARLRHAWHKAKTERERMVVLQEANKRGLVQKRIEDHLKKTEKP